MLNDTCADCTALPAIVNVAGPIGTLSTQYQVGSFILGTNYSSGSSSAGTAGTSVISGVSITATSKIFITRTSNPSTAFALISWPVIVSKTTSTTNGSFTVTSYCMGMLTISQITGTTIRINGQHGILSSETGIPITFQASSGLANSGTASVSNSNTLISSPSFGDVSYGTCQVYQPVKSIDSSTYDYVIIG